MPQIWLTFEEIADLFYCDTAGARRRVIANQWERRRYSDGVTLALLPSEVAHEFMLRFKKKHESVHEFDAAMATLCRVFSQVEADHCEEDRRQRPSVRILNSRVIGSFPPRCAISPQGSLVGSQRSRLSTSRYLGGAVLRLPLGGARYVPIDHSAPHAELDAGSTPSIRIPAPLRPVAR